MTHLGRSRSLSVVRANLRLGYRRIGGITFADDTGDDGSMVGD